MTILDTLADHARARTKRNKSLVSLEEMKRRALSMNADTEIGRASCRERVCQYV